MCIPGLTLDIYLPVKKSSGKANVLPLAAYCQRELIIRYNYLKGLVGLIHYYLTALCRCQGIVHILGRIRTPRYDINFFPAQLLHHGLHPGTSHTHTGPNRINI